MTLVPRVLDGLRREGAGDVVVTVGGTIPVDDVEQLREHGVAEVFTPGCSTDRIVAFIETAVAQKAPA
jgi:methylmalonyl-CoA mutase C-terminal domain/subunit